MKVHVESRTGIEEMFRMNAFAMACLVIGLALTWGSSSLAQPVADPNDPAVQKYFKDCDEFAAQFEKEHPAEVKAIIERLKKFHAAFYQYLLKHGGIWPQASGGPGPETSQRQLKEALREYGISDADWDASPSINCTHFDKTPLMAYRYRGQPWASTFGGKSQPSYAIVADGSIQTSAPIQPPPELMGKAVDRGGSRPAKVPEEMKKAAEAKPEH